jgi:effector-binding domain-containing protein
MKFLKYLLFLMLIAIIGFAIYIAVQPNSFEVSRERTINAPSAVLYDNVIDFKNWESWSSWVEKEPDLKLMYPEQTKGVGGSYSWEGKDGLGRMKTLATTQNSTIDQEMQFDDYHPSKINWTFEPTADNKTKVTWKMNSDKVPFLFKGFAAVSGGFDKMIGPDFERGLEKLDSIVVSSMKIYSINVDGITEHGGGFYLYNSTSCKMDEFKTKMVEMMTKIGVFVEKNNVAMAGAPFVMYHKWDEENNAVMFSCCVPTTARVITTESGVLTGKMKPFKAVKTTLKGNYENLKEAWDTAMKYIPDNGLEFTENGPMIEAYLTDPMTEPNPANWVTEIYLAVK